MSPPSRALYPAASVALDVWSVDRHVHDRRRHADSRREHLGQEITTGKVYSVVSDFLMQGNGYFRLYLPAGTTR